jgi:MFS family permease
LSTDENRVFPYVRNFRVLMLVSFLTVWGYGAQRAVMPVQMETSGTDVLWMGVLLSLFGLPRAAMNIVGGLLTDRFSKRGNMLFSIALFGVVSILLIGFSRSSVAMGIWRVLLAIGVSWATTAMLAYLADITLPQKRGTAFGMQKMFTWLGIALSGFFAPMILLQIGMRGLMVLMAVIGGIGLVFAARFLHDLPPVETSRRSDPGGRLSVGRGSDPGTGNAAEKWVLAYDGMLIKCVEDGIVTFFIPLYILWHVSDIVAIGTIVSLFTVTYVVFQPLGGWLADRIGSWRVTLTGIFLLTVGACVILLFPGVGMFFVFSALAGCGSGLAVTSAEMRASMIGGAHQRGRILGYWRFFRDLGSFFGPVLTGCFLAFGQTGWMLLFLMGMCLAALLASLPFAGIGRIFPVAEETHKIE